MGSAEARVEGHGTPEVRPQSWCCLLLVDGRLQDSTAQCNSGVWLSQSDHAGSPAEKKDCRQAEPVGEHSNGQPRPALKDGTFALSAELIGRALGRLWVNAEGWRGTVQPGAHGAKGSSLREQLHWAHGGHEVADAWLFRPGRDA